MKKKRSPCIRDCVMEDTGYCRGCKRTISEINNWRKYSPREREEIYRMLEKRESGEQKPLDTEA